MGLSSGRRRLVFHQMDQPHHRQDQAERGSAGPGSPDHDSPAARRDARAAFHENDGEDEGDGRDDKSAILGPRPGKRRGDEVAHEGRERREREQRESDEADPSPSGHANNPAH